MQPANNHPIFNKLDAKHSDNGGLTVEILDREVQEVSTMLIAATSDLPTPLGELVRAQIRRAGPALCAAVVLVVSKPAQGHEEGAFYNKRILLASALEMLHIALNIHRLLVNAARTAQGAQETNSEVELDRAFIGSIILSGDYCFSRAAQMAAQTDSPRVVATFSHALQLVSEGLLREQFAPISDQSRYDELGQLMQSGAQAAAQLASFTEQQEQAAIAQSQEFATQWMRNQQISSSTGNLFTPSSQIESLPTNWQILYKWLVNQRSNGEHSRVSYQPHP